MSASEPIAAEPRRTGCGREEVPARDAATLLMGDAYTVLTGMASHSVDCVVTSPPYWGLRNYRVPGQYGLEPTVDAYVANLARVFDELRRVLTPTGTAWLNLADTYGGSWGNYVAAGSTASTASGRTRWKQGAHRPPQSRSRPKDLQGVPWRVALELMRRGWGLRRSVVWAKPNARPESARDRLAQRYEMVFQLALATGPERDPVIDSKDVWWVPAPRARSVHVAPGPLELARRCVRWGCPPGGTVLDPFCGSGTTGLAALALGHTFVGIDLDPASCALARSRIAALGRR